MTFSDFKSLAMANKTLQVATVIEKFIEPMATTVPPWLRERLELVCSLGYLQSESAAAEGLIFPVLLEVWSHYQAALRVWREPDLAAEGLAGVPDYVIMRTAVPGLLFCAPPYAVIVEAKQEKFDEGWGQCLAAMVAAQRLNQKPDLAIYGIVTTGQLWQFGRLTGQLFHQDPHSFALAEMERLFGAVRYVFEQVSHYPAPPPVGIPQAA